MVDLDDINTAMGKELKTFQRAVTTLMKHPAPDGVTTASNAALETWAQIYDAILVTGGYSKQELHLFIETLRQCSDEISKIQKNLRGTKLRRTASAKNRIDRFRRWLIAYLDKGLAAVNAEIGNTAASA